MAANLDTDVEVSRPPSAVVSEANKSREQKGSAISNLARADHISNQASEASGSADEYKPSSTGDSSSILAKHELSHTWCLWALVRDQSTKDDWGGSQMNVGAFATVEDFWRLFNNVRRPSKIGTVDFSMFKKDIHPAWEDETCKNGGRWIARLEKIRPQDLDEIWLNLILTIVGENFADVGGHMVCGAVVSARSKNSKVALWVARSDEKEVKPIGHAFAAVLRDTASFTGDIHFEKFSEGGKAMFSLRSK
jgi:translation initiation factor 4E